MTQNTGLKLVTIYTDGACAGNPGRGGWAALLESASAQKVFSGNVERGTNNEMEFLALIAAMRQLKRAVQIQWVTDSRVAIAWMRRAQRGEWQKMPTLKSQALAHEFQALNEKVGRHYWHPPKLVAGHSGEPMNEYVNMVAQREAGTWRKK